MAWLREADAEFGKAVAASPGLRDLANLGFLQLDLVRAYCALGDASSVDDAERRLAAARAALVKRYDAVYESRGLCGNQNLRRVVPHAIDATPARWRGGAGSSPLDRVKTAASSPRNDLVKNCRAHPTHCLISTQEGRLTVIKGSNSMK